MLGKWLLLVMVAPFCILKSANILTYVVNTMGLIAVAEDLTYRTPYKNIHGWCKLPDANIPLSLGVVCST